MTRINFLKSLNKETERLTRSGTSKRGEKVIEGFTKGPSPRAIIDGREVRVFNSNDYLGFRLDERLMKAEREASEKFGTGPGAVRFISGTLKVHKELEERLAAFHQREAAIVMSSAFACNLAVMFSLCRKQNKDSLIDERVLVVSDELNHRSIIDGIRIARLEEEQKQVFKHMESEDLRRVLKEGVGKFVRAVVVTDGVFSMLGEVQRLKEIRKISDEFDGLYEQGVLLTVDDAHGIGVIGKSGRGSEEEEGVKADVLVGTLGKAWGTDGGYVVGKREVIDYLREAAATYIYSNSISPGTAGAALKAIAIMEEEGREILGRMKENINWFKKQAKERGLTLAADSHHAIQPVLVGDPIKCQGIARAMLERGFLITSINYPVVAKGKDELRIQLSVRHNKEEIEELTDNLGQLF